MFLSGIYLSSLLCHVTAMCGRLGDMSLFKDSTSVNFRRAEYLTQELKR